MTDADPGALEVRAEALEPLFAPWEEPSRHRLRVEKGERPRTAKGRRASTINGGMVQNLRAEVKDWRENYYPAASDTTRHLLGHWFGRAHRLADGSEFRYHFCQREAVETFVYLREVRGIGRLSELVAELGGPNREIEALGIPDDEDARARYAFKMATGSGKTKVMSLLIAWSYFHALRENDSPMARHFVVVAPNLTVFERLKEDFRPEGGGGDVFDRDPVIPVEWRGDWNLTSVLQDEAGGAATGATLYLTNIHRLYQPNKRGKGEADAYPWAGPAVSKAKALDTGAELRERIAGHPRLMVLNDEAHHVWDPDSAWNEAIEWLHDANRKRGGDGVVAQLDFSATPKDNKARYFRHIVCDAPLAEAVDAGIVKTPIIGTAGGLHVQATDDASRKYEAHLKLGYERWLKSRAEWEKSGKKPLLFVMCEDTEAADSIAKRLNTEAIFRELNEKTLNLHTRLKGRIKTVGKGPTARKEFEPSEGKNGITDEDLRELRKLSRELDEGSSPYRCIVSVLMLREGWDVKNVTTIVPLRPYTSKANILPEQTLGRGLRRMTPPGQAGETVVVVEHEAFARLWKDELDLEGLPIEVADVTKVPASTVTIYPDPKKDAAALEIEVPKLSAGVLTRDVLAPISEKEIRESFDTRFSPLKLGEVREEEVEYEGRQLITGEVVERMKVNLALLETGIGALSYYREELEYVCKIRGTHGVLAPLLQFFFEKVLFGPGQSIYDPTLAGRLSDSDVREHIRAVFVPLIRDRIVTEQIRAPEPEPMRVSEWRPFQATASERRPAIPCERTILNLVPCNNQLERAMAEAVSHMGDVKAFVKNAGPQALRIDYLDEGRRLAFYCPDFLVRTDDGGYVVEAKGPVGRSVPAKARAAVEWCKSASTKRRKWRYVYVPETVFGRFKGTTFAELAQTCEPALAEILTGTAEDAAPDMFAGLAAEGSLAEETKAEIVDPALFEDLPERARTAIGDAVELYAFLENKEKPNFAPVFTPLLGVLDAVAKGFIRERLVPHLPDAGVRDRHMQDLWFQPDLGQAEPKYRTHYDGMARNLKKVLVFGAGVSQFGLLRSCLDFALNHKAAKLGGVFDAIGETMRFKGGRDLLDDVSFVNEFRNTRIAHQETPLRDPAEAKAALVRWVKTIRAIRGAGAKE